MSDQEPALEEATIEELQHSMTEGLRTAYSLTEEYLERIERIDRSGPTVNSVLALNPDVLDTAAKLDEEREEKGPRGPLHGIPILLKDNLDTGDRMRRQRVPWRWLDRWQRATPSSLRSCAQRGARSSERQT